MKNIRNGMIGIIGGGVAKLAIESGDVKVNGK